METATTETTQVAPAAPEVVAQPSLLTPTNWMDSVPDKFKTADGINTEALFKSYSHLETRMGSTGLPPESADKYEVPQVFGDAELPEETIQNLKTWAHENGLTQKQMEAVSSDFMETLNEVKESLLEEIGYEPPEVKIENAKNALLEVYGSEQEVQKNLSLAEKAARAYYNGDISEIEHNPAILVQVLAKIGAQIGEDKGHIGGPVQNIDRQKLMASEAFINPFHPEHALVMQQVTASYQGR